MIKVEERGSGWGIGSNDEPELEETPVVVGWGQPPTVEVTPPANEAPAIDQV